MVHFRVSDKSVNFVNRGFYRRYEQQEDHYIQGLQEFAEEGCTKILQGTPWKKQDFQAADNGNGFVQGVIDAYSCHHNLVIRPDDVWLAITVQFGLFINANAEAMRSVFVDHQGKKQLTVKQAATLDTADFGRLASEMTVQLKQNVKDEQICDWVLPNFSTTTKNDVVTGSVVLMATLKSYFSYKMQLMCGIPFVTLEGSVEDWEEIHRRVDQLSKYGSDCADWSVMLKNITAQFVASSKGEVDVEFWNKVCHHIGGGSGPRYISGWISVFCVFDSEGRYQGKRRGTESYPRIDTNDIPPGYLTVDVKVDDNGDECETLMFAGHMGYDIVEDGKGIAPKVAWAIALKNKAKD